MTRLKMINSPTQIAQTLGVAINWNDHTKGHSCVWYTAMGINSNDLGKWDGITVITFIRKQGYAFEMINVFVWYAHAIL